MRHDLPITIRLFREELLVYQTEEDPTVSTAVWNSRVHQIRTMRQTTMKWLGWWTPSSRDDVLLDSSGFSGEAEVATDVSYWLSPHWSSIGAPVTWTSPYRACHPLLTNLTQIGPCILDYIPART